MARESAGGRPPDSVMPIGSQLAADGKRDSIRERNPSSVSSYGRDDISSSDPTDILSPVQCQPRTVSIVRRSAQWPSFLAPDSLAPSAVLVVFFRVSRERCDRPAAHPPLQAQEHRKHHLLLCRHARRVQVRSCSSSRSPQPLALSPLAAAPLVPSRRFLDAARSCVQNLSQAVSASDCVPHAHPLPIYRAFYIVNWIYRYWTEPHYSQWISWVTGVIQTAFYLDFFYYFYKSKTAGLSEVVLPL